MFQLAPPSSPPPQALEVYKLPDQIGRQVTAQYERDVARVHGGPVVSEEAEYRKFMAQMGGAPPPELMGLDRDGRWPSCALSGALAVLQLRTRMLSPSPQLLTRSIRMLA